MRKKNKKGYYTKNRNYGYSHTTVRTLMKVWRYLTDNKVWLSKTDIARSVGGNVVSTRLVLNCLIKLGLVKKTRGTGRDYFRQSTWYYQLTNFVDETKTRKKPRLPKETREKIKNMLINEPQTNQRKIARRCGVGRSTVQRIKNEYNIQRPNIKGGWHKRHNEETYDKVVKLHEEGVGNSTIARLLNIPIDAVHSMMYRYRHHGRVYNKIRLYEEREGTPIPTSTGKRITLYAMKNPEMSREELAKHFKYNQASIHKLLKISGIYRSKKGDKPYGVTNTTDSD